MKTNTKRNVTEFGVPHGHFGSFRMELSRNEAGWHAQAHCPRCQSSFGCGDAQGTASKALMLARDGLDKHAAEHPTCPVRKI